MLAQAAAIEKNQRVLIAGHTETAQAYLQVRAVAIFAHENTGLAGKQPGQRNFAATANFVAGNDGHADWPIAGFLFDALGRYDNFIDHEIRSFLRVSAGADQQAGHQDVNLLFSLLLLWCASPPRRREI